MTTQQLFYLFCLYLGLFSITIYFTRATVRRIGGALTGGAISALINLGVISLGESQGWWHVPMHWTPGFLALLLLVVSVIACGFVFLLTWRIARRFGKRGIVLAIVAAATLGVLRTYLVTAVFPEWIVLAQGVAPLLAIAVTFAVWIAAGHATMRLIAGPAQQDQLARRRGETA